MTRDEALADYPLAIAVPVWWGDQDAFGHVNNTIYFRWFESCRIAYLDSIGLTGPTAEDPIGPILTAISCNYRRPLNYPDTVHVGGRIVKIGRSSFVMEHVLFSEALQMIAADSTSTVVALDYSTNRSTPVPLPVRAKIEERERKEFPSGPA